MNLAGRGRIARLVARNRQPEATNMSFIHKIVDVSHREMFNGPQTDLEGEVRGYVAPGAIHGAMMIDRLIAYDGAIDEALLASRIERQMAAYGVSGPVATACARRAAGAAARLSRALHAPGEKGRSRFDSVGRVAMSAELRPPIRPLAVPASPFVAQDVGVGGIRLRYVDAGPIDAATTVLLIHGHSSRLEEVDLLTAALSGQYRVLALDLPGCGYSDHPLIKYSVDLYERTLIGFLDALDVQKVVPAGGSLGGNLSLRLGLRHASRVSKVVSWAPAGWGPTDPLLALANFVNEGMFWFVLGRQAEKWYSADNPKREELLQEAFAYRREVLGAGFINAYKNIANDQVSRSLKADAPSIRVPTLLLVGKHDHALDMYNSVKHLAAVIPGAKLIETESKHSILDEHPQVLIEAMREFCNDLAAVETSCGPRRTSSA